MLRRITLSTTRLSLLSRAASGIGVVAVLGLTASCGAAADPQPELTGEAQLPFASIACADGTGEDTFKFGMVGCAGHATWADRASLCAPGYRPASAREWVDGNGSAPTHNYWTNDDLRYQGSATSCTVSYSAATPCPDGQPMRVCTGTGSDAEGNDCTWKNCGYAYPASNEYFGGCSGTSNSTAGTLCVPATGCADGTVEQTFANGVVGCAGSVAFSDRSLLCAPGYAVAEAHDWEAAHGVIGAIAPTHNYWTASFLSVYMGSGTGSCSAWPWYYDTSTGAATCPEDQPMHVCTPSGNDPEGNNCTWENCKFMAGATNQYFGGCTGAGNGTAGALCKPVAPCKDGSVEQEFTRTSPLLVRVVACAGHVTWSNASSLCGPEFRLATAEEWADNNGNLAPTHNYWTSSNLRYSGTAASCSVSEATGSFCPSGQPMHVCTPTGADSERNDCNWEQCGFSSTTPNEYFGGCNGNGNNTAGAVCVLPYVIP